MRKKISKILNKTVCIIRSGRGYGGGVVRTVSIWGVVIIKVSMPLLLQ